MHVGFIGLGKMGAGMSKRLVEHGHSVDGYDASEDSRQAAKTNGVRSANSRTELVKNLGAKPIIWLMIPSQFVEEEIKHLLDTLPIGATVVDGGNSRFEISVEHGKQASQKGIRFLDVGVSGGLGGASRGYALMVGGDQAAYQEILPILTDLAQLGGVNYFGTAGSGHFVKMVHNAIEYALMEAYAEGFELIKNSQFKKVNMALLAEVWQHGSIVSSFLNSLAIDIFKNNPELEGIDGKVNMLGEAQWALEYAEAQGIEFGAVKHSIDRRAASQAGQISFATKFLAALRNSFGGHAINKVSSDVDRDSLKNV